MIRFTLPLPPSTNNLYVNVRHGRARRKSEAYQAWQDAAGWLAKLATRHPSPSAVSGPYALTLTVPAKMRGDVDNRLKAIADLLVALRITPDDAYAVRMTSQRGDVEAGQCIVEIESVTP